MQVVDKGRHFGAEGAGSFFGRFIAAVVAFWRLMVSALTGAGDKAPQTAAPLAAPSNPIAAQPSIAEVIQSPSYFADVHGKPLGSPGGGGGGQEGLPIRTGGKETKPKLSSKLGGKNVWPQLSCAAKRHKFVALVL